VSNPVSINPTGNEQNQIWSVLSLKFNRGAAGIMQIKTMNTTSRVIVLILLGAAASARAQSSPTARLGTSPTISEIATSYTNYSKITKEVVYVNFELAILCRGATKEEVDAARTKFGPHANTGILIYMNPPAAGAFRTNASAFPVGSVIVKQKMISGYRDKEKWISTSDTGVGGMVKRPTGYDPAHGDWEYFYFEDPKKIESGRIASCVQCHEAAKEKDHVFGTWRLTTK
jgi:hypothetical protein